MLVTFDQSILANSVKNQPTLIEGLSFIADLPLLTNLKPVQQYYKLPLFNPINIQQSNVIIGDIPNIQRMHCNKYQHNKQIEHLYVTLMRRHNKQYFEEFNLKDPQIGIILAKLYGTYPYLLQSNANPMIESLYHPQRSFLRLQESHWHHMMSKSRGNAYKWYIRSGLTLFALLNVYMLYRRVEFYMEHSFDILNPDIEYLIERY
eukprot:403360767